MSKTPKFDAALAEYFSKLELDPQGGQWRECRFSKEKFYVRPEDIEFYKSIRVPLPTLSPGERARRKFAFSNSYNLYKAPSSFSGKSIISQYPEGTPFPVYEHEVWGGDEWDPFIYARAWDPAQSFFSQIKSLMSAVPRPSLNQEGTMVKSEYCHNAANLKNCYLVFSSNDSEDCLYSVVSYAKNSVDMFAGVNCDTCYDCFEAYDSWKCFYSDFIKNCQESYFLYDCRGSSHCFGGVNLRNRKYVFFNEQLTREQYEEKLKGINMGDAKVVAEMRARFEELKKTAIHKPVHGERAVNSVGNFARNSTNCYQCFYPWECENLAYSVGLYKTRDSYDLVGGMGNERCYDSFPGMGNYGLKFSLDITGCQDLEYSQMMTNCHDCFGSIGLKNKSFCIFNEQFREDEYWLKVDEIKTAMLEAGEYGEFFPPELSPFPYPITEAMSYLGYDNAEVAARYGYRMDAPEKVEENRGEVVSVESLPTNIADVSEDIVEKTLIDISGKQFRIIPAELAFYKVYGIPLPRLHYSARLESLRKKLGPLTFTLHDRVCQKCGIGIQSAYPESDTRVVYCDSCYGEVVV